MRQHIRYLRQNDRRIALVPTMGNLHNGHIKLVDVAKSLADAVIVSIFINPMQFDRYDDMARYPRSLERDYEKLSEHHVDFVFSPALVDVYPNGIKDVTYVEVPGISAILEGVNRPGHFRGVSTIVSKLFNLIQPDIACFGEKDFQQLALIRKMVIDLSYDIDVIGVPIVRAKDGLALSSRNSYLTDEERKIAPNLSKVMNKMAKQLQSKKLIVEEIIFLGKQELNENGFCADILQIRDANTLSELKNGSTHAVILIAAWLGKARLIDNKVVNLLQ